MVAAGRRDEAGQALVKELRALGSEAEFINADLRKEDEVRALVDKQLLPAGCLDVRGEQCRHRRPGWPDHGPDRRSYAATFDTNVLGVILSMKHEVRVMHVQGSASIINTSSTYGHEPSRYSRFSALFCAADKRADIKTMGSARNPLRERPTPDRRKAYQYMCWPPFTESVEPVMKSASSATRNKTVRAMFLGLAEPAH